MKNLKQTPLLLLCFFPVTVWSQPAPDKILLIGNTYDADSLQTLPFVQISINNRPHILSDQNGHFKIQAFRTDTINLSVKGYDSSVLNLNDANFSVDTLYLDIVMKQQVYNIPEAKILPFHNYEEFKAALINMDANFQSETTKKNLDLIMLQNKQNIGPDKDAYANYSYTIRKLTETNNTLVFLSSDPGKGIFALMNALGVRLPWQRK